MNPYFDLYDHQFEDVVVALGHRLFGVGLNGFSTGPDGGRDAKFKGIAQEYPSTASPWKGCTIIQAKHTSAINASFSDKTVFNDKKKTGLIVDELPRLKALVDSGEAQNYLLISNRKLTGIAEERITKYLSEETNLPIERVNLAGTEQLDAWLAIYPEAVKNAAINPP